MKIIIFLLFITLISCSKPKAAPGKPFVTGVVKLSSNHWHPCKIRTEWNNNTVETDLTHHNPTVSYDRNAGGDTFEFRDIPTTGVQLCFFDGTNEDNKAKCVSPQLAATPEDQGTYLITLDVSEHVNGDDETYYLINIDCIGGDLK